MLYYCIAFLIGLYLSGFCLLPLVQLPFLCGVCMLIAWGLSCTLPLSDRLSYRWIMLFFLAGWLRIGWAFFGYDRAWVASKLTLSVPMVVAIDRMHQWEHQASGQWRVLSVNGKPHWLSHRMHFTWPNPPNDLASDQVWRITAKVFGHHPHLNPIGFNPYRRLWLQDSIAKARVLGRAVRVQNKPTLLQAARQILRKHWLAYPLPHMGIALALAIGDRRGIAQTTYALFQQTGTSHLLAISGLHVALVYRGFAFFGFVVWWLGVGFSHRLEKKYICAIPALLASAFYVALSGASWVTLRAFIMLLCAVWVELRGLQSHFASGLALAVFVLLCWDPLALFSPSFWFSVLAVFTLLYSASRATTPWRTQWLLWCVLLPITYVFFQGISWVSLITNPILIPWFSFAVVPFVIVAMLAQCIWPTLVPFLLSITALSLLCATDGLHWLMVHVPWGWWQEGSGRWWVFALMALGGAFLGSVHWRWGSLLLMLGITLWLSVPAKPPLSLHVLDVGQGLSVLVETPHHVLLYDTGPPGVAKQVLLPMIRHQGWKKLDLLLLSHGDLDHAGSQQALLANLSVDRILSGEPLRVGDGAMPCMQGMAWKWDDVWFTMLSPDAHLLEMGNRSSCVLLMEYSGHRILLPGDIDQSIEQAMVQQYPNLKVDVLVVPHHGSRTSSSQVFLSSIQPKWALISSGWHNRFGHPHAEVVARYQEQGIRLVNTAVLGAINLAISKIGGLHIH